MCDCLGACLFVEGGHCWGSCVVSGGDMRGCWGVCVVARGHVWLPGGVHGCRGHACLQGACVIAGGWACMVAGGCLVVGGAWLWGVCGCHREHAWLPGSMHGCWGGVCVAKGEHVWQRERDMHGEGGVHGI